MSKGSKKKTTNKPAAVKPAAGKKKTKNKNVSKTIPNGTFVITYDQNFYGADGKSRKKRMSTVVDSNSRDELAIVKYTTSETHGREFSNIKGFKRHGDKIYTLDNEGKPIKLGNGKFIRETSRRDIPPETANEIKRRNLKESKYNSGNRSNLRNLKGRKKKK